MVRIFALIEPYCLGEIPYDGDLQEVDAFLRGVDSILQLSDPNPSEMSLASGTLEVGCAMASVEDELRVELALAGSGYDRLLHGD